MRTTFRRHVGDEIYEDGELVMVKAKIHVLLPQLKL